jgi:hypothetical protein
VIEYQTVNLPLRVEPNFNTVFGNGWEMQLAKNKDPEIDAVMIKVGVQGPHFNSIISAWLISAENTRETQIYEGGMVLVPSPPQGRPAPLHFPVLLNYSSLQLQLQLPLPP